MDGVSSQQQQQHLQAWLKASEPPTYMDMVSFLDAHPGTFVGEEAMRHLLMDVHATDFMDGQREAIECFAAKVAARIKIAKLLVDCQRATDSAMHVYESYCACVRNPSSFSDLNSRFWDLLSPML